MLVVKKSKLPDAGKGLFTTTRIKKGEAIVEYLGEKLTWKQCKWRHRKDESMAYVFFITYKKCIDAQFTPKELARYANDASGSMDKRRHNNSEYQILRGKAFIVATKDIPAKAEILVDYGDDYWEIVEE